MFFTKDRAWPVVLPLVIALSGCETSRLDGMFGSGRQAEPEPMVGAPTSPVTSEPLPDAQAGLAPDPAQDSALGTPVPGDQMAALPPASPQPATPRTLAGNWKIADARGNCSITLTQTTLLDLYRATPSGCQAGSLAKVNAWQQRGQEIVLLEPGGRTAVRLFPKGDGSYEGSATSSGALIKMMR